MFWKGFTAVLTIALAVFDRRAASCTGTVKSNSDFSGEYILRQVPECLTYAELVELGNVDVVRPRLKEKLETVLTNPFISNGAFYNGARPFRPNIPGLGPSLRVVMWNIEKGEHLDDTRAVPILTRYGGCGLPAVVRIAGGASAVPS